MNYTVEHILRDSRLHGATPAPYTFLFPSSLWGYIRIGAMEAYKAYRWRYLLFTAFAFLGLAMDLIEGHGSKVFGMVFIGMLLHVAGFVFAWWKSYRTFRKYDAYVLADTEGLHLMLFVEQQASYIKGVTLGWDQLVSITTWPGAMVFQSKQRGDELMVATSDDYTDLRAAASLWYAYHRQKETIGRE